MTVRGPIVRGVASALLVPPAVAAVAGSGAPFLAVIVMAATALGTAIWWARRPSVTNLELSKAGLAGWILLAVLALTQDVRVSWYMADGTRLLASAIPNPFVIAHECLSGYTEATRLALRGGQNIYDDRHYKMPDGGPRFLVRRDGATVTYDTVQLRQLFAGGDLPRVAVVHVDEYEYPPPFLLLPYAVSAPFEHDVFRVRAVWFGLQACALWLAFLVSLGWPAREPESRALAWLPALWLAPPTLVGLQYGNVQTGVMAVSMIAMAAIARRRDVAGAPLLAFVALAKLFPAVLVAVVAARRQWRAVALTGVSTLAFVLLTLLIFGGRPFDDFVHFQVPAIANGAAFAFNDRPEWIPTNYGVYALVAKMRLLGVGGMTHDAGVVLATLYGIALAALILLLLLRLLRRDDGSAGSALNSPLLWLALLNLGALRSPYVGDGYAQVGTLWLMALVAAQRRWTRLQQWAIGLVFVAWAVTLEGFAPAQPSASMTAFSILTQVALIAFNVWVLMRALGGSWSTNSPGCP